MCKLRYRTMQKNVKGRMTDVTVGFIQDATLCYVKLQTPELAYNEDEGSNYTVDAVVSRDVFTAYSKDYPKNYAKKFTDEEFEEKYKIEPPYSFKGWNYVLKLKAKATIRKDMPEHKLYEGDEVPYKFDSRPKLRDEYGDDVTMDVLVGNGSVGTVAFTILETRKGNFPQLSGIKLSELIHYESDEDAPSKRRWSPFPDDLDDEEEEAPTPKRSAKKAPAKRSARDDDDEDEDEAPAPKRPVKKAPAKRAEPEDDEDEEEAPAPKRPVKKAPAKRPEPEDDDEEEEAPAPKRPVKKAPAKRAEPEDDEEEEAPAPKRPVKKSPAKRVEPEDDEEEEEAPAPKRPAKKAPAKAAEPEDDDGDDFDDDLPF